MGSKRTEIAVVGMACRFPGASGYDSFWENLIQGRNSISEIPRNAGTWSSFIRQTRMAQAKP